MRLVEIRDLDGPNIFLLQPAIKLELEVTEADRSRDAIAALANKVRNRRFARAWARCACCSSATAARRNASSTSEALG